MARVDVTPDFAYAVELLPTEVDDTTAIDETYREFISAFGTHYASALDMGAKAVVRSEFDQMSWTSLSHSNVNIAVASGASFMKFSASTSAISSQQVQMAEMYEGRRTSFRASYLASRPTTDGRWETWAQTTGDSPYPIKYVLRPLTELLTPRYVLR